jgi:predicted transcriptional regulator
LEGDLNTASCPFHGAHDPTATVCDRPNEATVLLHSVVAAMLGLHPTDYKVLGLLERAGAMSAGDIARHSGLATASVTNLIDRLEQKGDVPRAVEFLGGGSGA